VSVRGGGKSGGPAGKGSGKGSGTSGGKGTGSRDFGVRLKTAHRRTASSQRWLERQLNDPYVAQAKRDGYRSRAAYKLAEIDDKYKLLKPGQRIVDLGAAPGGWSQIAAKKLGREKGQGVVVAIDLLEIEPIAGVDFIALDFMDETAPGKLKEMIGGPADGVLSDMAANTTGHKKTDHLRIIGLAEAAIEFAREVLAPGGFFLVKLFQGGDTVTLINELKRDFATVRHIKPGASRADSSELYVLATAFRATTGREGA
jgi:23S rRNA (uridine2552-2'-O)-methyltransferase